MHANRCVICGEEIPEGLMVCASCERESMEHSPTPADAEGRGD